MKVIMREYFQGTGVRGTLLPEGIQVHVLEPGKTYEVDGQTGAFLVQARKAVEEITPENVTKPVIFENVTGVSTETLPFPEPEPRKKRGGRK